MINIDYLNLKQIERNEKPYTLKQLTFDKPMNDGEYLIDEEGNRIGTKGDFNTKMLIYELLENGCWDENPRPKYESDGTPAYTLSENNIVNWTYDISKGECPLITLRPIAIQKAIGEILWIYQDETCDLDVLKEKYGVTWWDLWDLKDENGKELRDIGSTYGKIIADYDQVRKLIEGIKKDPDGRRHIINMWQFEEFEKPHGLKPCAYESHYNIRHGRDGVDYLDMKLVQRSSDFMVAGCINQMQYLALMMMIAKATGYTPGTFTWSVTNVQIYDRHIPQAVELLNREPILENGEQPYLEFNTDETDFFKFKHTDFKIKRYARQLIKDRNPQQTFDKGV